jgi:hypothetical protein
LAIGADGILRQRVDRREGGDNQQTEQVTHLAPPDDCTHRHFRIREWRRGNPMEAGSPILPKSVLSFLSVLGKA